MARRGDGLLGQVAIPAIGLAMLTGTLLGGFALGGFPGWLVLMGAISVAVILLGLFWQQSGSLRDSLAAIVYSFFVLVSAVFIYLIVANHSRRFDLTEFGLYTLSPQTIGMLQEVSAPISVTAFVLPRQREAYADFFSQYEQHTDLIEFRLADPAADPEIAREFGENISPGDIFLQTVRNDEERRQSLRLDIRGEFRENAFSNALLRLQRGGNQRIYFTTGKGERPLQPNPNRRDGEPDLSLEQFRAIVEEQLMPVGTANLTGVARVPNDAAAIIIAGPTADLTSAETALLREYLEEGGSLLVTLDPEMIRVRLDNLRSLLNEAGIATPNQLILDPAPNVPREVNVLAAPAGNHPIVANLPQNLVLMTYVTRPLEPAADLSTYDPAVAPLLTTTPQVATADPTEYVARQARGQVGNRVEDGAKFVAVASDFTAPNPLRQERSRIVAFGDSDLFSNELLTNESATLGLQSVRWLAARQDRLDIPPRLLPPSSFTLTNLRYWTIIGVLILMTLALLVGGVSYTTARRRMG